MKKHINYSFLYLLLCSNFLLAQERLEPFTIGQQIVVPSEILNEDRPIIISTPRNYKEDSTKTYPVMYLLDGGGNFHHTSATVDFLSRNGKIPEMIIVAIKNTNDRTHDLTPLIVEADNSFPTSGGADSTLMFIEKELFSFIKKEYRVNDYKILVGHSFGGLFAIHTLINHPKIFNSYLAISPSLWWDKQDLVLNQSKSFFDKNKELAGHIYITMGNENNTMVGGAWKLIALLEEKGPNNLKWDFNRMIEESHGSIPMLSTYKGLEFIFNEWNVQNKLDAIKLSGVSVIDQHIKEVEKYYNFGPMVDENILSGLAQNFISEEKFDLALGILEKNAQLHSSSWKAQSGFGAMLVNMKQMDKAVPILNKALELNPDDMQSLVSLKKAGEDVSNLLPNIEYSRSELEGFAGKYLVNNEMNLLFAVVENGVWISGDGTPNSQILPIGKNIFFVDMLGAELTFNFEEEKVIGFIAKLNGQEYHGVKLD